MKKVLMVLVMVLIMGFCFRVFAAQITFTIDDSKLAEFKEGFLARNPTPLDDEGEIQFTDNQWLKEWGKRQYIKAYTRGKGKLAEKAVILEDNIIE